MTGRPGRTRAIPILYFDDHIVVIDKPPGVLAAPGRDNEAGLPQLLRDREALAGNPALRIVHRLDRDASGVLVLARTLEAQRELVRQFASREVEKRYDAIVTGYVPGDGEVNIRLTYNRRQNRVLPSTVGGKPAVTHYRVLQRLAGHTLLECRPVTGRTHQIRVHLAAIGFPLAVDPLYGSGAGILLSNFKPGYRPSRRHPERPLIERLTLHARRLAFRCPSTGRAMAIEAPLPKDMRAVLTQLGRLA